MRIATSFSLAVLAPSVLASPSLHLPTFPRQFAVQAVDFVQRQVAFPICKKHGSKTEITTLDEDNEVVHEDGWPARGEDDTACEDGMRETKDKVCHLR